MDRDANDTSFPIVEVADLDIQTLAPYRNLKDRGLKARSDRFIAEGLEVVRRLLQSPFPVESLLLSPGKLERLRGDLRPGVTVHVATQPQLEAVTGFAVHRGALACGQRPPRGDLSEIVRRFRGEGFSSAPIVALDSVNDAQNVGAVVRNAAAFGAGLVILSRCCDPFYRQAIRVSMGHVFRVPVYESVDLAADLEWLRADCGYRVTAAAITALADSLDRVTFGSREVLLFGSEGWGLSDELRAAADREVVIPMAPQSDSVNVAVATGIFLHACTASQQQAGYTPNTESE